MVKTSTELEQQILRREDSPSARDGDDITVATRRRPPWLRTVAGGLFRILEPVLDAGALVLGTVVVGSAGWAGLVYALAAVVTVALFGGYGFKLTPRLDASLGKTLAHLALPLLFASVVFSATQAQALLRAVPVAVALVLVGRGLLYALERAARRRRVVAEPTVIVGAGEVGMGLAHALFRHPEYGLRPVGVVDDVDESLIPPVVGPANALDQVLDEHQVRRVVVAFGAVPESELVPVLRRCARHRAKVYATPRFFELGLEAGSPMVDHVRGVPLVALKRGSSRPRGRLFKRGFDVAVSSAALLVAAPVMLAVAVAVRASGPGPILFRQRRIGEGGRPFELLKFRSLHPNDDSDTQWSVDGRDDRVTPVGRIIRRTGLDELPQLFNVLRGDMSIVGPRPERPHFSKQFEEEIPGYRDRQRVPGGVTGWAQVHGLRGDTSIAERSRFDNQYIEHWSPWLDLVICARTVRTLLRNHDD